MKTNKGNPGQVRLSAVTLVVALVLGMLISLPFRMIDHSADDPLSSATHDELIRYASDLIEENNYLKSIGGVPDENCQSRVDSLTEQNENLKAELEQRQGAIDSLEAALLEDQEASAELQTTLDRYRILAGLVPVSGPGIKLTLSEDTSDLPQGAEITRYLIHQEDLLNIVNELWLAGAEAIAIRSGTNTERLTMRSSIRCVGSLIDVNNTRMTPPFEIFAIGDPDTLYNALLMPRGVLEPLQYYNINADIVKLLEMELPMYRGSTIMEYAGPLEEE